ncbi:MAG: pilus assembly protein PilM [Calditrichia bacterium]|nr:pilus assembly protein PilM [Calditrichia bacterium]
MAEKINLAKNIKRQSEVVLQNKLFGKVNVYDRLFANTYLGIDIGVADVRYVYLYRMKDKFEIISYGMERLPQNDLERDKAIKLALRNLFTKRKMKATQVILSVYGPEISTRIIELPKMAKKDLRAAIILQNKNEITYFTDDTVWDYEILTRENVNGKVINKILVIVAHNEAIIQYVESLKELKIKPSLIIPKPKAHEASYKKMVPYHGKDLIIEIGLESTMFCYFDKGKLWYVRNIAIGNSNLKTGLEKEIKKNEALVVKKLENMGRPAILNDKIKEKIKKLSVKSNPALEMLLLEVRKTIQHIQTEFKLKKIEHIYLCGSGSLLDDVQNSLKNQMNTPTDLIYPIFRPVYNIGDYIDFVSPFGAALYLSDSFNLIPGKYHESWRFNYYNKWAYFAGFVLFIVLGMLSVQKYNDLQTENDYLKLEVQKFESLNPKFVEYQNSAKNLKKSWTDYKEFLLTTKKDDYPIATIAALSNTIPEGMMVTDFKYERAKEAKFSKESSRRIVIMGETYKNEHLWDTMLPSFVEALKRTKIFDRVYLVNQEYSAEEKKGVFSLELSINIGKTNEKGNKQ